jgi:hypothetical protein
VFKVGNEFVVSVAVLCLVALVVEDFIVVVEKMC